ncbi:predicted protein [Uncinocarpus reesii 1704]|uniref:Uncharacterized protein n=1 Tax=Uncinocarpus reesii (strain UAMH 1704) TaxID=336963 RepID=C4JTP4_UNCRE|nr:uncharacterized protein UREG_05833 [Uncinocarpus reesii 1704]EEP80991.1 predicted protein [Uncinocarpus reesii 1704]
MAEEPRSFSELRHRGKQYTSQALRRGKQKPFGHGRRENIDRRASAIHVTRQKLTAGASLSVERQSFGLRYNMPEPYAINMKEALRDWMGSKYQIGLSGLALPVLLLLSEGLFVLVAQGKAKRAQYSHSIKYR